LSAAAKLRLSAAGVAPVIVLLLTSLIPAPAKDVLVFWRLRDTLPGHRAFSVHAKRDPRIDLDALRNNVGEFPDAPRDQNARWYQLYKEVESDAPVVLAHRHYLLFRDLAPLSLFLAIATPLVLLSLGAEQSAALFALLIFLLQYAATAVAARNSGVRFVTTVLALHAAKRRV
jgi:hypothetical protein